MEGRSPAGGPVDEAILDSLVEHVVRHDRELRITWANRAACESVGLSREEVIGRHCYELWACRDDPCPDCPVLQAMNSGERHQIEKATPDGRAWLITGSAVRDEKGSVVGGVEITLDITDRKRAEDALRESGTLLTATINSLPFDFYALDREGRYMLQNSYCRRRWGEVTGRRPEDLDVDEQTRALWVANNRRALAGETIDEEVEFVSRGGAGHYRNILTPIRDEGFIRGILGVNIDITERKLAEAALLRERDLLNAIIQTSIAAITIVDREGRITFANPQAERVLGLDAAAVLARTFNAPEWHITSEEGDPVPDGELPFTRVMLTGEPVFDVRHAIKWLDGTRRLLSINGAPLRTETGEIGSVVFAMTDITERKRVEEQRLAHLSFLQSLERVDQVIRRATDLEEMMSAVLEATRSAFDCDRAWLLHPCDPEASSWRVPMERTAPEYPGALALEVEVPMDEGVAGVLRLVLGTDGPVKFGPGSEHPLPEAASRRFNYQSQMGMAVHPKTGVPWMFGLHQCSYPRQWSGEEERLFQEIGRRIADSLSTLLMLRDLRRSERRLATLMDNLPGMAYRCRNDERWTMLFVSDGCLELTGYQSKDLIDNATIAYADLIHPEDRRSVHEDVEEAIEARDLFQMLYRIRTAQGRQRWVWEQGRGVFDDDGRIEALEGFITDITERQEAEAALIASEQNYRAIFDAANDALFIHDAETGQILDVNQKMCDLFGYTREEVRDRTVGSLSAGRAPYTDAEALDWIRRAAEEGPQIFEWLPRRKNGEIFWAEVNLKSALIGGEQRVVAVVRDITERKLAEEALHESEERFRCLSAASLEGIVIHEEGAVIDANEACARLFGYDTAEIAGMHAADVFPPESLAIVMEKAQIASEQPYEIWGRRKDGTIFPVEVVGRTMPYRGRSRRVVAVRDITERKQAEEALRDREARLRLMMEQMPAVLWTIDRELRFTSSQGRGLAKLGLEPGGLVGLSLHEYFRTGDSDALPIQAHRRALDGESVSYQMTWADCDFDSHVEPLRDGEGRIIGAIGTAHDVTERRRAEQEAEQRAETVQLLLRELDHRVRNNLSSLISLVEMTGRATDDVPGFAASITSRVRAIATTHALLSTAQWQPVQLRSLIVAMTMGEREAAVHFEGSAVEIPASQVQAVGIVINELVTNSHKHGALSTPEGRLSIRWQFMDGDDPQRRLLMHWDESGGPRIEQLPDRGVGIELVEGLVRSELRGKIDLSFTAQGVRHRFEMRLDEPEAQ